MIKICPTCGKEFKTRYNRVKYCSHECYIATRKKEAIVKVCPVCGVEFIDKKHPSKIYCGNECRHFNIDKKSKNKQPICCKKKHYKSHTRIHNIWRKMKTRCFNKNDKIYKYYGGKGITVCPEWKTDFMSFYDWAMSNGYTDDLTIDRIDVNGNYEPKNCRWTTMKVQANNTTRNRYITYKGETHTLSEWCDILGIDSGLVRNRIYHYNWSIELAFTTPPKKCKRRN